MKNDVLDCIKNRTSLRVFEQREISTEEKDKIIESAMLAPTAGNQMLYSMIIIADSKKKERLAELCDHQPFIAKAPLVIVFVADHHKWFEYFEKNGVRDFCQDKDFVFEAPQESDLFLAMEDTMIAAQNSVIAAESMGIGSCYIGDIMENCEQVQALLKLPQYTYPIGMVVYGHYKENHKKIFRKRFDREFVVFEDEYKQLSDTDYQEMFADQAKTYSESNPWGAENYAQQFYARKTGAAFCKEMARSTRVWLKQWDGKIL